MKKPTPLTFIRRNQQKTDRAVSEVIGYTFIFSGVVLFIVLMTIAGTTIIDQEQSVQATISMNEKMTEINDQTDTVLQGASETAFVLELPTGGIGQQTGDIQTNDVGETEIVIQESAGSNVFAQAKTTPIIYTAPEGEQIVYDAGIIASDPTGQFTQESVSIQDSNQYTGFQLGGEELIFPVFAQTDGNASTAGSSGGKKVLFQMFSNTTTDNPNTTQINTDSLSGALEMKITTTYPNVWRKFFTNEIGVESTDVTVNGKQVTAQIGANEIPNQNNSLVVGVHRIQLQFD